MRYSSVVHELGASIKRVGVWNSLLLIVSRFYDNYFDARYDLDTVDRLELDELEIEENSVDQGQMYQPSGVLGFRRALKEVDVNENTVFVDYGSGKGRTVLIAAMNHIKRSVGIEFSSQLIDCANKNTTIMQNSNVLNAEVKNICCDASKYHFKDDETLFYFFFPFDDELMTIVIDQIADSLRRNPRHADIIYYYPVHDSVIANNKNFSLKKTFNAYGYECHIFSSNLPF